MAFILTYDIGTTGVKTCLLEVDKTIRLLESTSAGYPLYILEGGGAEQDGDDWWNGMSSSTKELFDKVDITPDQIEGISFCSQMQGLVIVDKNGEPIRLCYAKPVTIGNDCWFGANVTVCPGVTIGNGVVIGAGSVVTRDIPDNCVAAGNPARVIRELSEADSLANDPELLGEYRTSAE